VVVVTIEIHHCYHRFPFTVQAPVGERDDFRRQCARSLGQAGLSGSFHGNIITAKPVATFDAGQRFDEIVNRSYLRID